MSSSSLVKPKLPLELDIAFEPVGDYACKFSTRAGDLIRSHVPVTFAKWRTVPDYFKDDVWAALTDNSQ
ncbi:hypothetical protein MKW98_015066 [Papaver atlanticum]|uniref:Uncharacterized protein n=1 Tax=Papaver atlanticum TaxID=357466 RepID=A0AAD4S711_9MAGN|nr:hypothetical protein MKW98_015066 [Papaver atlanticum]